MAVRAFSDSDSIGEPYNTSLVDTEGSSYQQRQEYYWPGRVQSYPGAYQLVTPQDQSRLIVGLSVLLLTAAFGYAVPTSS